MRLRVATLNVWGLPEPFSLEPLRRLRAIGDGLAALDLDVIGFQEVWFGRARRILREAGLRAGLSHAWGPEASLGGSGLLVLSRLPIESASLSAFALRGHPEQVQYGEYYGGKGWVELRLATRAGPVSLVDTHLHARYASASRHAYRSHRTGQIVQLAAATRDLTQPLIAVGDFNFTRSSEEHRILTGLSALRDVAHQAGSAQATVLRTNPFRRDSVKPDRRVDYVFTRDGAAASVRTKSVERIFDEDLEEGTLGYSDHAGVLAELEIGLGDAASSWSPSQSSIATARALLASGRADAKRRRAEQRRFTGAGLGVATLVAVGDRRLLRTNRRRFLRAGLQVAAAAALAPSVGCSLLSEVFAPTEILAYDRLARALDHLRSGGAR